jgi:hypothetical protein
MSAMIYNTWLLDQSAWDLVLDASGNIALAQPPYALAQDVASAVRTFLGELWYDTKQGVPYWTQILGKLPSSSLLIELINQQVLSVSGVVNSQTTVTSFSPTTREVTGQIQFVDSSGVTTTVNF